MASGILRARVRTNNSGSIGTVQFFWEYADSEIDVTKFVMAYNTDTKPVSFELWAMCDKAYDGYHFDVLGEGTRTTRNDTLWTLYQTWSAGSQAAPTPGYAQLTSSLLALQNATSGNAATASKWHTPRTFTIGNSGKAVDGSANLAWTLAEIGAAPVSHAHSYLPLAGGTMTGTISNARSGSYVQQAANPLIRYTGAAGSHQSLYSWHSTNGYFSLGGYENMFSLNYLTASNVAAGTNTVTKRLKLLDETGNSSFPGTVTANSFSGTGSSLVSLNASNITSGTLASARLPAVTRNNTVSALSAPFGGAFPVLDSVSTDSYGRITAVNTKTITMPANPNTDTKATQANTAGSADYRMILSYNANDTTETNTLRKSINFKANPATGEFYAKGYRRISITGQTLDLNTLTLSSGSPNIMRYIQKTDGGCANITNIPVSGKPFLLDVELIRWGSATDYITMQTFRNAANGSNEYVRYCTNGTWSGWSTRVFTDTRNSAGATNTSSKIFLVGAASQTVNPQTYSHDTAYVGTDGCLYSNNAKVSVEGHSHSYLPLTGGTITGEATFNKGSAVYDGTVTTQLKGIMGSNDYWRIGVGATANDSGFVEFATADNGNEPIYVRQYTGGFVSLNRSLTLLDSVGNSFFPGTVSAPSFSGNLIGNAAGNSGTATKLQTSRKINNTSFDGTADITTAKWGTARTINYVGAATSSGSLDGSVNKSFTLLRRGASVGQSAAVAADKPWYKFASLSLTGTYQDAEITFKVSTGYSQLAQSGILRAHIRNNGSGFFDTAHLYWEYANSSIDPKDFVMVYNTGASPTECELWCKCTTSYMGYHFAVIAENTRNARSDTRWTLYNTWTAGSWAAPTSGYTQLPSTFMTISNPLSGNTTGNAATATKASQDSAGQQINTTYIKSLTAGGQVITYTKGNGTTGTLTTLDTKNTAGSAYTGSKIFLLGATSQTTNPVTYSHDTAYVGTDGHLYSNSKQVINSSDTQALTNKTYNGYSLAAACARNVYSLSAAGDCGWGTAANRTSLIDISGLAYWNGAYSGTSSNLTYCSKGAFGTVVTKNATDYSSAYAIGTSTRIPTERDIYYGLPTINNAHTYTSNTKIFAPASAGTSGQVLTSTGGTPAWTSQSAVVAGKAAELKNYYTSRPASANIAPSGSGGLITFKATSSMTTAKPGTDSHIVHLFWDSTGGYDSQIASDAKTGRLQLRGCNAGTWNPWLTVLDSGNYSNYALPKSGGTVTGTTVFSKTADASGTANNSPALIVGGTAAAAHLELDSNEIMAKTYGTSTAPLYINNEGGDVHLSNVSGTVHAKGNNLKIANDKVTMQYDPGNKCLNFIFA